MTSICYLTFDDGPYSATASVLDILLRAQVKATFFLTAINLEKNPDLQYTLIKRMIDEGHALGNHGYDHDPASRKGYSATTPAAVKQDFIDNQEKLSNLFARKNSVFPGFNCARLPGDGRFMRNYVSMITRELKLPHIGWDFEFSTNGRMGHIRFKDWQGIKGVAGTKRELPSQNNIILMHDAHWAGKTREFTALIDLLKQNLNFRSMQSIPSGHRSIHYPQAGSSNEQ